MPLLNKTRAIIPKIKQTQLPKLLNLKLFPKDVKKQLKSQNPKQKTLKKRVRRSRIPDRAGTLQPREISVEISLWNRGEERADDNGSSREGGKDWRIDIQRENRWNGGKTKRFTQVWKQIGKEEFINTGFYLRFKDQNSQQRLEENKS
ncbi:MAG: hypothetical protein EZS28_055589, partial [Streblomastix strix]